jgi:N-acetylglutamate synthase-like GNAT family acetyltransferase
MKIRKGTQNDNARCLEIAKALPEWFDEKGILEIGEDLINCSTYVYDSDGILAYACILEKSDKAVEIKQLAVKRDNQRNGIGTELLKYVEREIAPNKILEVKTLDESCKYKPYERTRAFYGKNGFTKVEVVDPFPGWSPGNPCAIYIRLP